MIDKRNFVNYDREDVEHYFYEDEFRIEEYDTKSLYYYMQWINTIYEKHPSLNPKDIQIDIDIREEAEGFGYGYNVIYFIPYINRKETDEEYTERIKKEEAEYEKQAEAERLMREKTKEYQEDMKELKRIKEKYNMK